MLSVRTNWRRTDRRILTITKNPNYQNILGEVWYGRERYLVKRASYLPQIKENYTFSNYTVDPKMSKCGIP